MSQPDQQTFRDVSSNTTLLFLLSLVGVLIGYTISIVAARTLGPKHFNDYAVAIAAVGLLSTIAEAGVGKYAFRVLPQHAAAGQWNLAAGFWRFCVFVSGLVSLILIVAVVGPVLLRYGQIGGHALLVAVLFLPAMAWAGVGIDLVMANRLPVTGTVIGRLIIPGTTLILLLASTYAKGVISVTAAILCFGAGSITGVGCCLLVGYRHAQPALLKAKPQYQVGMWLRQSVSFAVTAFLMSWMFRISLLVMEAFPVAESEVGYLAAALDTSGLLLLLSKSTDKLFQPDMSSVIEKKDWVRGNRLRWRRYTIIASICLVFLTLIIVFGRRILDWYGPGFRQAYPALCLITGGSCIWTLFSLAPTYLMFTGQAPTVITIQVAGGVAMAVLTAVLGTWYGVTGAGCAVGLVLCLMAGVYLWRAQKEFNLLKNSHDLR